MRSGSKLWSIMASLCGEDRRAGLHAVELAYLAALAFLLAVSWLALVLAELGVFSLGLLALLLAGAVVAGVIAVRRQGLRIECHWTWDIVALVPVVVIAGALFAPPFEYNRGALDPGTYVNAAASIARSGSIIYVDEEMASLSDESRRALFREEARPFTFGSRLPGFYIVDLEQSRVTPHGFHLYPALLAVAFALGGTWATLWVLPLLAVFGLAGFALLGRRLFGTPVAVMAALLLAVNPGEIWFAHYPAAEILVQVLLYGGLLALVVALDTDSRVAAVLAGLSLGAVHLAKIEQIALPVATGGFIAYSWLRGRLRRVHIICVAAYALVVGQAALHAYLFSAWYAYSIISRFLTPALFIVAVASLVLALVVLTIGRRAAVALLSSGEWRAGILNGGALAVLLAAAYAYYVRPRLSIPSEGDSVEMLYEYLSSLSFVALGWYAAPLGLVLGVGGYATALIRHLGSRTLLLFAIILMDTVICLYEGRITPVHFWAARRYLPVVFPAFALCAAILLWELYRALHARWPLQAFPGILGLVLTFSVFGGWLPFLGYVEYEGQVDQVEQLAATIPEGSVVLFDESDVGLRYSVPMQYMHGRPSFVLWQAAADAGAAETLLNDWVSQGKQVYAVRSDRRLWELPPGYEERGVASGVIDVPEVVVTTDTLPTTVGRFRVEYTVARIEPVGAGVLPELQNAR